MSQKACEQGPIPDQNHLGYYHITNIQAGLIASMNVSPQTPSEQQFQTCEEAPEMSIQNMLISHCLSTVRGAWHSCPPERLQQE